jgi:hypothetical protein
MPCLVVLIALLFPRIALSLVWIFSNYLGRAYQTVIWPVLGFIFMPLTTLAYAWAMNSHGSVSGFPFAVVLFAALVDLGILGSSESHRRHRRR